MKRMMLYCVMVGLLVSLIGTSQAGVIADWDTVTPALLGPNTGNGVIVDDGSGSNNVLKFTGNGSNETAYLVLPTIAQDDDTQMVTFDIKWEGTSNLSFGVSDVVTPPSVGTWHAWADYAAYVSNEAGKLKYRDNAASGSFVTTDIDTNQWLSVALVLSQTTETYDVYINGSLVGNDAQYRDYGANGDLVSLIIKGGEAGSPSVYLDNVAVSTVPEPATMLLLGLGSLVSLQRKK